MPLVPPSLVRTTLGRWSVPVPWNRADELRSRLHRKGFSATVCLDPDRREAALEPWPGVDPLRLFAEVELMLCPPRLPMPAGSYRQDPGHAPAAPHRDTTRTFADGLPVRASA